MPLRLFGGSGLASDGTTMFAGSSENLENVPMALRAILEAIKGLLMINRWINVARWAHLRFFRNEEIGSNLI